MPEWLRNPFLPGLFDFTSGGKSMNKTGKKLLSLLVTFSMIISMFVMTSVTASAAENVPKTVTLVAYPKAEPEFLTSLSSKASSLKTSKASVVSVKQTKNTYGSRVRYTISLVPKKAGTATVSLKCKGKTYKTRVTVKKYTNPIKSVKIGTTSVSASKFNSSATTSLSYARFAGKNVKTTVFLKSGWKLQKLFIYKGNPSNGSTKPAVTYAQKGWRRSEPVANGGKIPVKGGKGFKIMFTAINTTSGVSENFTIELK